MSAWERRPNLFAETRLDRAPNQRREPEWLADRLRDSASRLIPVWRARNLVTIGECSKAVTVPPDRAPLHEADRIGPIFLGLEDGAARFAADLSPFDDPLARLRIRGAEFLDLHRIGALLSQSDGALLAYARGMIHWHRRHLYCGRCGHQTVSEEGGHVRRCEDGACGILHFPRTDPAIIVLVTDSDACLLGRQKVWPANVYSTLAGFVEPGESLGEAVVREVAEETGVPVRAVSYHSSQPWPFPSSLMLGFTASGERVAPRVDGTELEEARWFERDELLRALKTGEIRLPSEVSIARRLIVEWLETSEDPEISERG